MNHKNELRQQQRFWNDYKDLCEKHRMVLVDNKLTISYNIAGFDEIPEADAAWRFGNDFCDKVYGK